MEDKLNDYIKHVKDLHQAEENCNLLIVNEYKPLMKYDLTAKQEMILKIIHNNQHSIVSELAEKMNVTLSAVSQIISKLEQDHFIKRAINPNNRREIIVSLDEKGEAYFRDREQIELKIIKDYYSKLTIEEIQTLKEITQKLERLLKHYLK